MLHAPSAADRERDGVAFEGEVVLVEDPIVIGVGFEGLLDAGYGSGDVGFC